MYSARFLIKEWQLIKITPANRDLDELLVNDLPTAVCLPARSSVALLFFSTDQNGRCEFSAWTAAVGCVRPHRGGGSSVSRIGVVPRGSSPYFVVF